VVRVQIHAPAALPPAEEHPVSTGKKIGWGQRGFWTLGQQKTLLPLRVEKRTLEERRRNVTAPLCVTLLFVFTSESMENLVKTRNAGENLFGHQPTGWITKFSMAQRI